MSEDTAATHKWVSPAAYDLPDGYMVCAECKTIWDFGCEVGETIDHEIVTSLPVCPKVH
jgi:hypothetical protein